MSASNRPRDGENAQRLEDLRRRFSRMLSEFNRRGAQRLLQEALAAGHDPAQLLREVVGSAIEETAQRWSEIHLVTLSQVYVSGLIIKDAVEMLSPGLASAERPVGKVVIGVAEGDHHGMGRATVSAFLRGAGFVVTDLGTSVSPKTFVDAALAEGADIIAVSALMIGPALGIREVRQEMDRRQVRQIRLLVGGAPFRDNPKLYQMVGADATAPTAYEAVAVARRLMEDVRSGR